MVNPFYVQPAQSDLTPVLQGIGAVAKQARETTQANAKQKAFMEAAQSGDPTQMTALVAKYPDLANAAREQFGITNEASGAAALDTYQRVLSDPSRATEYLASGIEQVRAAGGRPDMMTSDLQMFQQDPETALQKIRMGYAMFGGDKNVNKQFGGQEIFKDEEDNLYFGTTQKDPKTGEVKPVFSPMPGSPASPVGQLQLTSSLGLTAAQQVTQKQQESAATTRGKTEVTRFDKQVDEGLIAADSYANIKRGIDLLDQVETGGFENVSLRAKKLFGIESADEGELSNRLGKAVLSQLRETFGAAFTENEGARLERIEAGFGKSTAANKRLLKQAERIVKRAAERGIRAAERLDDTATADEIRRALEFSLTPEDEMDTETTTQDQTTQQPKFIGFE